MAREAVACGLMGFGFGLLGWALTSRIHMCIIWNMTRWPVDISLTCRRLHSPIIPLLFLLLGLSCECSPVSMMHRPFSSGASHRLFHVAFLSCRTSMLSGIPVHCF